MLGTRGENLRSIYVLLFLNVAFFFLEYQDPQKYARLFSFERDSVLTGEVWRLFTYQFTQAGQGWFFFPKPVVLFFTLLILYIMGAAVEEEWGTFHFLTFFALSTLGSAAIAAYLGIPLLGSYFVNFSLLFVYASMFPEQTFYLFAVIPIRVRWLAYIAVTLLLIGVVLGGPANSAAFGGAAIAYLYYVLHRIVRVWLVEVRKAPQPPATADTSAIRNAARFVAIKKALVSGSNTDIDRLIARCERDIVRGVNICSPVDYKPENNDGYCIRCEGFAECSARYLKMNRREKVSESPAIPEPATQRLLSTE